MRLARTYARGEGADPLLPCEICGKSAAEITCVPSLVSGEVIGSVLVRSDRRSMPRARAGRRLDRPGAPVLANLRNLAIAETRAATDALTGLPNPRSCHDNLKRMVAQAGRTCRRVSAVLLDLDHFKQINDRFGHGAGDDVAGRRRATCCAALRASDFAGRYGGEEFLVLLPDTDREGALEAAEKVAAAIEEIDVAQVDPRDHRQLGVATYPADAADADTSCAWPTAPSTPPRPRDATA